MAGRNVIVTGASPNSLGYETARILASWGASVVVTSVRDVELMENSLKDDLRRTGADGNNLTHVEVPEGKTGSALHRISSALASLVLQPVTYGAQTIVMCASKSPLQGGRYYYRCSIAESTDESKDAATSKLLWDKSEAWVGTLMETDGDEHEQI